VPIEPFEIAVPDEVLDDLRARIRATRWPDPAPGEAWGQGTDLAYLTGLLDYWADGFDWRAREAELNELDHLRADLDGTPIHFVHRRAPGGGGIPLILTHGWPSSFVEYTRVVPLLDRFDLVIPSLPGYGFSGRPARTGVTTRHTATLWHQLMRELGYDRYGAQGGDFGAGVASYMAMEEPERMIGVHLHNVELMPYLGEGSEPLSDAEREYLDQNRRWAEVERGYSAIQSTKPQTVAYGLTDSPAGLAAWIVEKWRSWTDSGGDPDAHLTRDFLLTTITLYWATRTIGTSLRDYYDNRFFGGASVGPDERVRVPTAIALFANHLVHEGDPPREWVERLYDVVRWTPMPRGGHFAPAEEPEAVARDITEFFTELA
jgi:pimeloyl-ACP methyl ester carboxylesterase